MKKPECGDDAAQYSADCAFPGFTGAESYVQFVFSELTSEIECPDIACRNNRKKKKDPNVALWISVHDHDQ